MYAARVECCDAAWAWPWGRGLWHLALSNRFYSGNFDSLRRKVEFIYMWTFRNCKQEIWVQSAILPFVYWSSYLFIFNWTSPSEDTWSVFASNLSSGPHTCRANTLAHWEFRPGPAGSGLSSIARISPFPWVCWHLCYGHVSNVLVLQEA